MVVVVLGTVASLVFHMVVVFISFSDGRWFWIKCAHVMPFFFFFTSLYFLKREEFIDDLSLSL